MKPITFAYLFCDRVRVGTCIDGIRPALAPSVFALEHESIGRRATLPVTGSGDSRSRLSYLSRAVTAITASSAVIRRYSNDICDCPAATIAAAAPIAASAPTIIYSEFRLGFAEEGVIV